MGIHVYSEFARVLAFTDEENRIVSVGNEETRSFQKNSEKKEEAEPEVEPEAEPTGMEDPGGGSCPVEPCDLRLDFHSSEPGTNNPLTPPT